MSDRSPDPKSFLPLTEAAFHVLLALLPEDAHGYSLLKTVREQAGGVVRLSTGTLYGILSRLLEDGLIAEAASRESVDERRRYYRITPIGRAVARAEAERLERTLDVARARALLKPRRA
jgi:DNA-binding PadR family transcriptional regulator